MSKRAKYFFIDDEELTIDFGTYALLMYYAMLLNNTKAAKLFYSTSSEWFFRYSNGLPYDGLDAEDTVTHFVVADNQEVIQFISNELIISLDNEPKDLLIKYGGRKKLASIINGSEEFIGEIGLDDDEYYFDDKETLINILNRIKSMLQYALDRSAILNVDVY